MGNVSDWQRNKTNIFWGEMAPCEHAVQIYENDGAFLEVLEEFVSGGLQMGESVIVIATPAHRDALEDRLCQQGLDLEAARSQDQYIPLDAEEALSKFMVNGWPDETLFKQLVNQLLVRARKNGQVRAFGEMVALLWAKGQNAATVGLEHLWSRFCEEEAFCLFCAYPKSGFTRDADASIREICTTHSRVIASSNPAPC